MGNQKMSGLTKRGGVWHVDKVFGGTRICESTETSDFLKAQEYLAHRIDQIRNARVFGVRVDRAFRVAATKFLEENQHKRSIDDDATLLKRLDPFIGDLMLRNVHMGTLQPFIAQRRIDGVKTRTIDQLSVGGGASDPESRGDLSIRRKSNCSQLRTAACPIRSRARSR
jgi:hypothetical protein